MYINAKIDLWFDIPKKCNDDRASKRWYTIYNFEGDISFLIVQHLKTSSFQKLDSNIKVHNSICMITKEFSTLLIKKI